MARGPGRTQRAVIARLLSAPEHRLTRRELEDSLCPRGIRPSNLLRALRSLERACILHFNDCPDKSQASVALLSPERVFTDDEILTLIRAASPS